LKILLVNFDALFFLEKIGKFSGCLTPTGPALAYDPETQLCLMKFSYPLEGSYT